MAETELLHLKSMLVGSLLDPLFPGWYTQFQMLQVLMANGSHLHPPQKGLSFGDWSHFPSSPNPCGSWELIDGDTKGDRECI